MLSMVDSRAVFAKRIQEMNLGSLEKEFTAKGWCTYGEFCFATTYSPGVPTPQDALLRDIIIPLLGVKDTTPESLEKYKMMPALCKLQFES